MIPIKRFAPLGVLLCSVLAACDSGPVSSITPVDPPTGEPVQLAQLACTVTVASGAMQCRDAVSTGPAGGLLVGGQHKYVALTASNHSYTPVDSVFTIDVTVQNLIPQPLGTTDGTTLDSAGVKVFFYQEPQPSSGDMGASIAIEGDVQRGMILEPNQAFYRYDEIIAADSVSSAEEWRFSVPSTVTSFAFSVYVYAAVEFPDGWIDLSESADTLLEGGTNTITATVINAYGDTLPDPVTWESSDSAIATVNGSGQVTAVAPGAATITATQGPRTADLTLAVCPDLAVGEAYTASMPAASSICFAGGTSGAAEYTYMPVNLSSSSALSLSLTGTGIQAVTGPPSPSLAPGESPLLGRMASGPVTDDETHIRMLERDRAEAARLAGRQDARIGRGRATGTQRVPGGPSRLIVPNTPTVGDLWNLNVASGCSGTRDDRVGRVVSIGQHVIVVADTMNPPGGFTTAQYDSIRLEFDTIAYPVDTANFGGPTDLDTNERVVAFYTRAVNELSPPASSSVVTGYFTARDLFSSAPGSCPRSNEGEMFYMLVPDPTGVVNSNVRTVSFVRGGTVGTMGHELQHLINASRRIYIEETSTLEEVWLNEGLSHISEELAFYRTSVGLAPRQNIQLTNLTTGPNASRRVAAFNTYANQNYGRFRSWLQRPDTAGAFKNNDALAVRGAIWAFLRYAADRRNGDDATLWYDLVNTPNAGVANLQDVLGLDPNIWLRDFTSAMYADDAVAGIGAAQQITSWNFRSIYGGLGGFPLGTRNLTNATPLTLSYSRSGGTAYARFGVPQSGFAGVTALSGGVAPTSPYALIVIRTK